MSLGEGAGAQIEEEGGGDVEEEVVVASSFISLRPKDENNLV